MFGKHRTSQWKRQVQNRKKNEQKEIGEEKLKRKNMCEKMERSGDKQTNQRKVSHSNFSRPSDPSVEEQDPVAVLLFADLSSQNFCSKNLNMLSLPFVLLPSSTSSKLLCLYPSPKDCFGKLRKILSNSNLRK